MCGGEQYEIRLEKEVKVRRRRVTIKVSILSFDNRESLKVFE